MGWGNIYKRRMKVFTLALMVYLDYKAVQHREKWTNKYKRASLWDKSHERNAKRILNLIIELEGLWVKLGQYLSTRADVLPEAYINVLKQLQDSLPPRPLQEVRKIIQNELGKSMDELFTDFVEDPIATASIAQVHRATLRDGRDVVVKVQHESIKAVILEDLKNAKSIVDWIAWAEPQYDFNPMIDEWCKEAPKELDFNHEAENTRTVSKNLGCQSNHATINQKKNVDVLIPEVIQSSEKVLILEYMDGIRLNDAESLEAFGVDKQKLVEEITRAYAHQIYVDGFFNGDPHPGNFLVSKEPPYRPILLDFGLTKLISSSMKQALAKMFLAAAEGDHVALLSAFAEMGLRLRMDLPEQAMMVTNVFFRASTPASEAHETMRSLSEERTKTMKTIQDKVKLSKKEVSRFNPVDAFPGDAVIFVRVLNLLRGLSAALNVRVIYLDIMRPFAESVLQGNIGKVPATNAQWISTPVHSDVEAKLRQLLMQLGNDDRILGIQVCAYKDGEVIIDTAAGVLGRYDPRPVQPDSLFPVFSATKGITAGMLHWLVDNGKLKLEENVANIWSEFGTSGKNSIKVHHVLNHTSGLHNAMASITKEDPLLLCDWEECLNHIAMSTPENEPGHAQLYHYLSFGWLCGGIIERAAGKKFQDVLNEAIVYPLNIDGEFYIGIPPGVESRLATLTVDMEDLKNFSGIGNHPGLPSSFQVADIAQMVGALPILFNSLNVRRAIIPAANGHFSARALARYYATLAAGGIVPPPHTASEPSLGSHPQIPTFPPIHPKKKGSKSKEAAAHKNKVKKEERKHSPDSKNTTYNKKDGDRNYSPLATTVVDIDDHINKKANRIFQNPRIHDAFMGLGEYENMTFQNGSFGLGFKRFNAPDGAPIGFGHSGMGGSTGFCDVKHNLAIAVTVNKMSLGTVTGKILHLICSELNVPIPEDFSRFGGKESDGEQNFERPMIN